MYPVLYNDSGTKLAILNNIIKESAKLKRVVNGEFIFSFEAYEEELKSEYFAEDNVVVVDSQSFDIKYIEQMHANEVKYKVECEHVNYRLEDGAGNLIDPTAYTGTPTSILTTLLAGTDFTVGTVDFAAPTTITVNTQVTRKKLIYQIANELGGEIEYTANGFTINLLNTIGANNGFQVRFGKNLKGITKIIDARGDSTTTYYKVDIVELKNSHEYINKDLGDLEVIEVGDTVDVIDSVIGLSIQNRIISIERNPIFGKNIALEIANEIELITDSINSIDTSTVKLGKYYNSVGISAEDGFVAERSDNKARTVVNATDGIYIETDEGAGYTKNFYVNTSGRIVAQALDIAGDSTFGGRLTVYDGANIQVDIFEDSSGGYALFNNDSGDRCVQIGSEPSNQDGLLLLYNGDGSGTPSNDIRAELSNNDTLDTGQLILSRSNRTNMLVASAENDGAFVALEDAGGNTNVYLGHSTAGGTYEAGYLSLSEDGDAHSIFFKGADGGTINLRDNAGATKTLFGVSGTSYLSNSNLAIGATSSSGYELYVQGDEKINGGSLTIERDTNGGFVFIDNDAGDRAIQLGLNSTYSYQPGALLLYNGAAGASARRVSIGVNSTSDYGFLATYYGANTNTSITNSSGDARIEMYDASGTIQNLLLADGNNYLNNRLSVGNSSFITYYSINTEEGIRCPYIRLVELSADPAPTTDGVMFCKTNKLYVILAGSVREVALV